MVHPSQWFQLCSPGLSAGRSPEVQACSLSSGLRTLRSGDAGTIGVQTGPWPESSGRPDWASPSCGHGECRWGGPGGPTPRKCPPGTGAGGGLHGVTPKHPGLASSLGCGGDPQAPWVGFPWATGTSWWPRPGFLSLARQPLQLLACGFPCRAL